MWALDKGRQERPSYTNLQQPGLLTLDYMRENIGSIFKENWVSLCQQNHLNYTLRTSEEVRMIFFVSLLRRNLVFMLN